MKIAEKQRYLAMILITFLVVAVVLAALAWHATQNAWTAEPTNTLIYTLVFYESWLMPAFLLVLLLTLKWQLFSRKFSIVISMFFLLGCYARFIEPNRLLVHHTTIKTGYPLKLALISDMHYGLFSSSAQMQQLVDRLNSLDVDAVVVAGDWTNEPTQTPDLAEQLRPFQQVHHPIYSVPGNHDEEIPGPPLQQALKHALLANHIQPIEGTSIDLGVARLIGLGDLWRGDRAQRLSALTIQDKPLLLLTHNPDTLAELPKIRQPFVMLAGHTHGGQINVPMLTEKILQLVSQGHYKRGLYALAQGNQIFVTSGIGMVGLPLRFAMPPVIDVLEME